MIEARVIDPRKVRDLAPDVIGPDGVVRVMPASYYEQTTIDERALLGARHALYNLPTVELIDWLREKIGGRAAIEIGAAHGVLARELGITATDSYMQADPAIKAIYNIAGNQVPVRYGPDVVKLAAEAAVDHFKPKVVLASWVTHRWREDRHQAGGNMFGVDEEYIIDNCDTYIFIGNAHVHWQKSIWTSRPHHTVKTPPWLYSRAHNGSPEFIAVWERA